MATSVLFRRGLRSLQLSGTLILAPLLIFLLALAPRMFAPGHFLTVDEAYHWMGRVERFLDAIRSGAWADTFLVGHPGITTLWLGALGRALYESQWQLPGWSEFDQLQTLQRAPIALTAALCVALGYLLLRRLLPQRVAVLAALLWATDPFLVAHSQLLHLDALLTSFVTLSLLAALIAFRFDSATAAGSPVSWPMLLASAATAGLALLTKSPAIVLVPFVGLIGLASLWQRRKILPARTIWSIVGWGWSTVGMPLLVWAVVVVAVWVALFPAAWVDLPGVLGKIIQQARLDGGSPHGWGNFFLGQSVADPGPLFYPVAITLRLTPWTFIGIVTAAIAGILALGHSNKRRQWAPLALLAFCAILFVAAMSIPPKKFDRYALPIFPTLNIIAAAGWVWIFDRSLWILKHSAAQSKIHKLPSAIGIGVIGSIASVNLAYYHPYELAYYNPLVGGAATAVHTIPVGWGEGYEQVGAYINAQRDGADWPVAAWFGPVLDPYVNAEVVALDRVLEPGRAGYAVLYIDQVQRRNEPAAIDFLQRSYTPVHTVQIHGIDYAQIYHLPRPALHPVDAQFGDAIHFLGYDLDTTPVTTRRELMLTVHWYTRNAVPSDYMLFVHVLDAYGNRIGQADVPPAGSGPPTSAWQPGQPFTVTLQVPLEVNWLPATYWFAIGLYDPQTGNRLALRTDLPQFTAPDSGPNALRLGPLPRNITSNWQPR